MHLATGWFSSCLSVGSLTSQPYFSAYAHVRAKVGGGREGKIRLGTPARFSWLQLKILS